MSVLTKVFVVLVTVLSVALMGVVLANVASQENYKGQTATLADQNKILEARLKTAAETLTDLGRANTLQVEKQSEAMSGLQEQIRQLTGDLAKARAEADSTMSRVNALDGSVKTANANVEQATKLLEASQKEAADFRRDALESKTKEIDLAAKNSELAGKNDGLTKQVRFDQETISKLKDENGELRQKLAGTGGTSSSGTAAAPVAPAGLRGQVTAVDPSSGTVFVQVNIGSADGVQPGMKFYVFSSTKHFLGQLVIQKVDDRVSAGYVQRQSGTIGVGDGVLAGS